MNREHILSTVRKIVAHACGVSADRIEEQTSLRAIGLDSVKAYEMIVELEIAFDLSVPPEHLDDLAGADLAALVQLVESLIGSPAVESRR